MTSPKDVPSESESLKGDGNSHPSGSLDPVTVAEFSVDAEPRRRRRPFIMRYLRSFILGTTIVIIFIVLSGVVFYFSLGACPSGSFSCDDGQTCVPQMSFCDQHPNCKDGFDESTQQCGTYDGSGEMMDLYFLSQYMRRGDNASECILEVENLPEECICEFRTSLLCPHVGLETVPRAHNATKLILRNNSIRLTEDSFHNFANIILLNLDENEIEELPNGVFSELKTLQKLYLSFNHLEKIEPKDFQELHSLEWLFVNYNNLKKVQMPVLPKLQWLDLSGNYLTLSSPDENFPEIPLIFELVLDENNIETIRRGLFSQLHHLHLLTLRSNRIQIIEEGAFEGLNDLRELDLSDNILQIFPPSIFHPLQSMVKLNIGNTSLHITVEMFRMSYNLTSLKLDGIKMSDIDFASLRQLQNLKAVNLHKFHYCSLVPSVPRCTPNSDGVSDLKDLLRRPTLRLSAWIVAIVTIISNMLVLWGRGLSRDENKPLSLLIRNLAVADMLMGFYLLSIAVQDARFRGVYNQYSQQWTSSWSCIITGITAMVSCEVSMLILCFMSVERFLLIVNPLGGYARLNIHSAKRALFTIWSIGLALAILPVIHWKNSTKFYGTYSGMCFPLHLLEKYPLGWQYSAFMFLGVNLIGLLVIASVYCGMFVSVWQTRRAALPSTADCEFAIRFFFIVLTDAACWVPIICLKILNFFDIEMSADVYAWLVVFILPLNSAINPILYTFTTAKYRDLWSLLRCYDTQKRSSNADTESSRTSSNRNIMGTLVSSLKNVSNDNPKSIISLDPIVSTMNNTYSLNYKL